MSFWLIVICNQAYYDRVVNKFDHGVRGVDRGAVMGGEGVTEGAEDTPLWYASVQDKNGWCVISHPVCLRFVAEEVQYPHAHWTASVQFALFVGQNCVLYWNPQTVLSCKWE